MNQYFVTIDMRDVLSEEFLNLIPEQRDMMNKLMYQGIVTSFALSADRTKSWLTFVANNPKEVVDILETFPLRKYFKFRIDDLAFHIHASLFFPQLSLN